jgi:hypothetical protein
MDTQRAPLNVLVSGPTRAWVRETATLQKCGEGELIEAALLAYYQPGSTPETEHLVFARLLAVEETLAQVLGTLQALVTLTEAQVNKPVPPKIASYDEMYGPLTAGEETP